MCSKVSYRRRQTSVVGITDGADADGHHTSRSHVLLFFTRLNANWVSVRRASPLMLLAIHQIDTKANTNGKYPQAFQGLMEEKGSDEVRSKRTLDPAHCSSPVLMIGRSSVRM